MHCGAVVVAGNNSSQVEVVGDAGLLANAHDSADISAKLEQALTDDILTGKIRERAVQKAATFRWQDVASRSLETLTGLTTRRARRIRAERGHVSVPELPRIAVFSPWPPKRSGIAEYTVRFVRELRKNCLVDLYHDEGYVPDLGQESDEYSLFDYRLFPRHATIKPYDSIIYHMGNSPYHMFIYEMLRRFPGIVTLHDFNLSDFHEWLAKRPGSAPDQFERDLRYCHPELDESALTELKKCRPESGEIGVACAQRGLPMNRRIFEFAPSVVVHSPWCREQVRLLMPEHLDKTAVIPLGATPRTSRIGHREEVRSRYDLPRDALVIGCFGILHSSKMNIESIEAFARLASELPSSHLMFIGQDLARGEAQARVASLGLEGRVRFVGRIGDEAFLDLIDATDIGLCLRRPPTNGEMSGALIHLLRSGVPTIVNDVGTFAGFPDDAVRKVQFSTEGIAGLTQAMLGLARNRQSLSQSAKDYMARRHAWPSVINQYRSLIEVTQARRNREWRSSAAPFV